jgi:hypothetical protein
MVVVVEVLKAGAVELEVGLLDVALEAGVVAGEPLGVDKEAEALVEAEAGVVGQGLLLGPRGGEARRRQDLRRLRPRPARPASPLPGDLPPCLAARPIPSSSRTRVNIVLLGPNGVGKTMLAQNLAHHAVMHGASRPDAPEEEDQPPARGNRPVSLW